MILRTITFCLFPRSFDF